MMKKYILIFISAIATCMVSCENFLDIDQPDIVEKEQNFQDFQSIQSSVIGIYSTFAETVEPLFLAGEVRADLVNTTENASSSIREFENNSFSSSNNYISARPFYNIIVNSNEVLTELDESLTTGVLDTLEFENFRGELLAMRAWSNMHLLKLFGKCKYVSGPMDSYASNNTVLEYETKEETLTRVITDLEEADLLKVGLDVTEWDRIRISRFYINALLGEAYLMNGMYKEASDKFLEVMRKGDNMYELPGSTVGYADKFKLSSKFQTDSWWKIFSKYWVGYGVGEEYLFYIGFDEDDDQINDLQKWTTYSNGTYQVKPSSWIISELVEIKDPSRTISIKEEQGNTIINKYNMDRASGISDAGFIVQRAARMHLQYAEAMNRLGYADTALMVINGGLDLTNGFNTLGVRGRVDVDYIEPEEGLAGDDLMYWVEDLILDESARECAFEGTRWFDLQRFAERRNDPSILADRVSLKFPINDRELKREQYMNTTTWYLPLTE